MQAIVSENSCGTLRTFIKGTPHKVLLFNTNPLDLVLGTVNISEEETKRAKSDSVRCDKEQTLSICIITLKQKIGNIFLRY